MQLECFFVKSENWEKTAKQFVECEKKSVRPKKRFFLRIQSEEDVKAVKKIVPILFLDSDLFYFWNYPMSFPSTVIVPREFKEIVETDFKLATFEGKRAFENNSIYPRLEDFIVFLFDFDLIACRALIERNKELIDFGYLVKRIVEEKKESQANQIYLEDFVAFPFAGEKPLPKKQLLKAAKKNFVKAII